MEAVDGSKSRAGIGLIDETWGGIRRRGSYLMYGPPESGCSLLSMLFLRAGASETESGLYIDAGRSARLARQAAALGVDWQSLFHGERVKMIRFPAVAEMNRLNGDERSHVLADLADVVELQQPRRVVIDDVLPLVNIEHLPRLCQDLQHLVNRIESLDTTLMVVCSEPEDRASRALLNSLTSIFTGAIHVGLPERGTGATERRVTLYAYNDPVSIPYTGSLNMATLELSFTGTERADSNIPSQPASPKRTVSYNPSENTYTAAATSELGPPEDVPTVHTDRAAFSQSVQQHFHFHSVKNTSFVLIAMRGDGPQALPLDFSALYRCTSALLSKRDGCFVDFARRRLVVLLSGCRMEAAHRFFARLKSHLTEVVPDQAETYLNAVTAIVVPNGQRFQNSEEFLSVALDE